MIGAENLVDELYAALQLCRFTDNLQAAMWRLSLQAEGLKKQVGKKD